MTMQAGTYKGKAAGPASFGTATTGNPQVAVTFNFTDPTLAGRSMTWLGTFTEKSEDITLEALRNCGWKTDDLTDVVGPLDKSGLADNEVDLVIVEDNYTDKATGEMKSSLKIRWVNRGGRFKFQQPLDQGGLAALSARMKGAAIKSRQAHEAGSKPKTEPWHDAPPADAPDEVTL